MYSSMEIGMKQHELYKARDFIESSISMLKSELRAIQEKIDVLDQELIRVYPIEQAMGVMGDKDVVSGFDKINDIVTEIRGKRLNLSAVRRLEDEKEE